jgi:hypothetical protein
MNFSEVNIVWIGLNWLSDWPNCKFSVSKYQDFLLQYHRLYLYTNIEVHNIYDIFMSLIMDTNLNHSDYRIEVPNTSSQECFLELMIPVFL